MAMYWITVEDPALVEALRSLRGRCIWSRTRNICMSPVGQKLGEARVFAAVLSRKAQCPGSLCVRGTGGEAFTHQQSFATARAGLVLQLEFLGLSHALPGFEDPSPRL